jgi:hypothetical protein
LKSRGSIFLNKEMSDPAGYVLDLNDISNIAQQVAEKNAARFYADVAPKINVREAQRALEKAGKEHAALA